MKKTSVETWTRGSFLVGIEEVGCPKVGEDNILVRDPVDESGAGTVG
jgi:hypothetical protein